MSIATVTAIPVKSSEGEGSESSWERASQVTNPALYNFVWDNAVLKDWQFVRLSWWLLSKKNYLKDQECLYALILYQKAKFRT